MLWNILLKALALFGLRRLRRFGGVLASLVLRRNAPPARFTDINLRLVYPKLDEAQIRTLVEQSVDHTGRYLLESIFAWGAVDKVSAFCEQITGLEAVRQSLKNGKGVVLLTPHCGCTELATIALTEQFPDSIGLYRSLRPRSLYRAIEPQRFGRKCRAIQADFNSVKHLRAHLLAGGVALMATDIVPKNLAAVEADMMGIRVKTNILAGRLSRATAADVFAYCGVRTETGFEIVIIPARPEISSADKTVSAIEFNRLMAELIGLQPAQGHWFLKRFSSNLDIRQLYKTARLS